MAFWHDKCELCGKKDTEVKFISVKFDHAVRCHIDCISKTLTDHDSGPYKIDRAIKALEGIEAQNKIDRKLSDRANAAMNTYDRVISDAKDIAKIKNSLDI